ncbi:hypothetical protein QBC40DRAFT_283385 [Triangularia verruculosa]|uniref:Uncharacterized protein n=1 Tax=Triangularia verruculosa TaxID=2587418 RepID=A0AAN6XFY4_9PEZI|nr:hypothetical protein QBC40DRAFT_283385 [Triangularia verruculosa]
MKYLFAVAALGLAEMTHALSPPLITASIPLPSDVTFSHTQTGCPTVTQTRELCATCPIPACLVLGTITQSCNCPTPIPTVYLDYPCSAGCSGLWCATSWAIVQESGCGTVTATPPPSTETTSSKSKPWHNGTYTGPSTKTKTTTITETETDECEPTPTKTATVTISSEPLPTSEPETSSDLPDIETSITIAPNSTFTSGGPGGAVSSTSVVEAAAGKMRILGLW